MSTRNLCFKAKIRKNVYPCTSHFYYIEWGVRRYRSHGRVIQISTTTMKQFVSNKTENLTLILSNTFQFAIALLTPTLQPVRDLFATDFFATDWRSMRLGQPLYAHIRIEDYNRRLVGDRFATGLRLIGDWLP